MGFPIVSVKLSRPVAAGFLDFNDGVYPRMREMGLKHELRLPAVLSGIV